MTNKTHTLIAALFIAFTGAACTEAPDADQPSDEIIMVWERDTRPTTNGVESRPDYDEDQRWTQMEDPNNELADSVCRCESDECDAKWVEETFGCGVCVLADCGDGEVGGGCSSPCLAPNGPVLTQPVNETADAI